MRSLQRPWSLLALAHSAVAVTLPYNPTRIFLPPNSSYAYVFGPSAQSNGQAQLAAVDVGVYFTTGDPKITTVSATLPFLYDDEQLPYTPMIDAGGNITVIAGQCSQRASDVQVWQFQPELKSSSGQGIWSQRQTAYQSAGSSTAATGPSFLANGIAFSDSIYEDAANTDFYVFGGMCPFNNGTAGTWISAATYSNSLLTASPDGRKYDISTVESRAPPIRQAGSSLTPLPPTFSNSTEMAPTQQQDFVLLGGNTEDAFINMSQVAMFSLPQQSWSFIEVYRMSHEKTDLAIRGSVDTITPRSGHTAVLSESGDKIILYGGWVGDVSAAAEPQLMILELGAGYGGSGDWKWTIPEQTSNGSGVYGHGATMLPGGVMMIYGGYDIPSTSSRKAKREAQTLNNRMLLYNTTSNTWLDSYTPPVAFSRLGKDHSDLLKSTSAKVGLGTGLGIGAAIVACVLVFHFWYGKRLRKAREERERSLLSYSPDGYLIGQYDQPFLNSRTEGGVGDEAAVGRYWPQGAQDGGDGHRPPQMQQHSTGAWVDVPSPTRGLRKASGGKSYQYHSAPAYEDNRRSRGSGHIHPIAEHEDEDDQDAVAGSSQQDGPSEARMKFRAVDRISHSPDPFTDTDPNPLGSHPISPSAGDTVRRVPTNCSTISLPRKRPFSWEKDVPNWKAFEENHGMALEEQEGGFAFVNNDDRTSSTLSDLSMASTNSITRTMSTRTGALLAAAANRYVANQETSPTRERTNITSTNDNWKTSSPTKTRRRSSTTGSVTGGAMAEAESFVSVKPGYAQYQSEAEEVLSGRRTTDPDDPYQRAATAQSTTASQMRHTISSTGPPIPPRRRPGLMGSLRRALNAVAMGDRSFSLTSTTEPFEDGARSAQSSPTKDSPIKGETPARRAVSDGGALLRQKRGQKDWDEKQWPPYQDDPDPGDWGEPRSSADMRQAEEDWDVEGAATSRNFQVMFTVPKSRLRVVNDDMDRASLRSATESNLSRNSSMRRVEAKPSKTRLNEDEPRLPATEEESDDAEKEKEA